MKQLDRIDLGRLERLVVVWGGDFDETTGRLTEPARRGMEGLARALLDFGINSAHIAASYVSCTNESARVLSEAMGIGGYYLNEDLTPESTVRGVNRLVERICQECQPVTLILVTHRPIVESFPPAFIRQQFGRDTPVRLVRRGEAVVINCEAEPAIGDPARRLTAVQQQ